MSSQHVQMQRGRRRSAKLATTMTGLATRDLELAYGECEGSVVLSPPLDRHPIALTSSSGWFPGCLGCLFPVQQLNTSSIFDNACRAFHFPSAANIALPSKRFWASKATGYQVT